MQIDSSGLADIGVVVIGRNEGDRLIRCLNSLISQTHQIVYVDSASTDESVNVARGMGAEVVSLDMTIAFTAARARNEGFKRLRKLYPQIDYVQFIDGDCEITYDWLKHAVAFMSLHQTVAAVCGRRRERFPERSIYNMLCDIEWDTPIGEAKACGGDALMRVSAFEAVKGFRPSLIAGEEPELCVRLRAANWKIWRLDLEMTQHDAAMTHFMQWWKRSMRGGYAYAEGAQLHGEPPERHWVKESRRALLWGFILPLIIISMVICLGAWAGLLFFIFPAQILRLALSGSRSARENWLHAIFLVIAKFPESVGELKYFYNKLSNKSANLIEYK